MAQLSTSRRARASSGLRGSCSTPSTSPADAIVAVFASSNIHIRSLRRYMASRFVDECGRSATVTELSVGDWRWGTAGGAGQAVNPGTIAIG